MKKTTLDYLREVDEEKQFEEEIERDEEYTAWYEAEMEMWYEDDLEQAQDELKYDHWYDETWFFENKHDPDESCMICGAYSHNTRTCPKHP